MRKLSGIFIGQSLRKRFALSALQHTRRKAASIPSFADGKLYE
jgi:hypothetical protein